MAGIGDILLALSAGGLIGSAIGGGQGSQTTTTQTTQATLPPSLQAAIDSTLGRGVQLSKEPFTTFPGPRIAPFNAEQIAAMNYGIGQHSGGQQLLDAASAKVAGLSGTPTTAQISGLMNPFDSLVTANTIRELDRRNAMAQMADAQKLRQIGAFGGGRMGVIESTRAREHERLVADALATGGAASYNQALNQFNTGNNLGLEAGKVLGGFGQARPGVIQNEVGNLYGIGALGQGQAQASLDLAYKDFLEQREFPYKQLGFMGDLIGGVPSTQSSLTATSQPTPSMLQQLSGIGLGIAGLFNQRNSQNSITQTR